MKFVVTWKPRVGGSAAENEAGVARVLAVYGKWAPPADATFHQFVVRTDGGGGFAVLDALDPAGLALSIFKLAPFLEYAVYPVIDVDEAVGLLTEAVEFRTSIT